MLDLAPDRDAAAPPGTADDVASAIGAAFVDAIVAGDFDRLEGLLATDVRFRAITPQTYRESSTAAGARAVVVDWFGGTADRDLVGSTVERIGDRSIVGFRLELTDDGERRVVEQHAVMTIDGGWIGDLAILCSGFRPFAQDPDATLATPGQLASADEGAGPSEFSPAARLDATGLSCATLTPTIAATVRGLESGAVLEIVSDDPDAEEGLRSWTRLTGNELVAVEAGPGSIRRFGVRRTPRRQEPLEQGGTN